MNQRCWDKSTIQWPLGVERGNQWSAHLPDSSVPLALSRRADRRMSSEGWEGRTIWCSP